MHRFVLSLLNLLLIVLHELMLLVLFRNHEWFKVDLQSYLFPSPVHHDDNIIDVDIVIELCEVSLPCYISVPIHAVNV